MEVNPDIETSQDLAEKRAMKINVLFITNGSLTNPILFSQGLPYLFNLDDMIYKAHIVSFERSKLNTGTASRIEKIKMNFGSKINFHFVKVKGRDLIVFRFWAFTKGLIAVTKIVKDYDIKILHARNFFSAFLSIIIKLFVSRNLKILYDIRGLAIEERIFSGKLKILPEKLIRRIEELIVKRSDSIVVVSKKLKEFMETRYGNSISKKITVITNKAVIRFTNRSSLEELKPKDYYLGVYSGSVASWQNIDGMLELFRVALTESDNIRLKVLSWQKKKFELKLSCYPELKDQIEIICVEPEEVFEHLIECSFGIVFREKNLVSSVSSPLKFSEYLLAGLPILIKEGIGDTEEIIKKYKIGIIIKGNDYASSLQEMTNLLKDEGIYSRCREVGEREFNIKDSFKSYRKVYEKLTWK